MDKLSVKDIKTISGANDFHIAPFRPDGKTYGTPTWIWSVSVDGKLFVRAYNGTASRWYNAAITQRKGKIEAAGLERSVDFEPVNDDKMNERIDEAYRKKYATSAYLNSMISNRAKAATVQVF